VAISRVIAPEQLENRRCFPIGRMTKRHNEIGLTFFKQNPIKLPLNARFPGAKNGNRNDPHPI
jgi:hypothetical protein